MKYPKLYLSMDNCFAIKRWITPEQWMRVIKDLGASVIEASTDNEIDPLFCPEDYRKDWVREVKKYESLYGMQVKSFFTGYQTYRTAGLAHPDPRMRNKIKDEWFKPLIDHAEELNSASIGFSFHAFQEEDLNDSDKYKAAVDTVVKEYAELSEYAAAHSGVKLCCEQMYAPYQHPWRIAESKKLISDVYKKSGSPFFIALDVGHMVGQRKFTKPDPEMIKYALGKGREGRMAFGEWLGPEPVYQEIKEYIQSGKRSDAEFVSEILSSLEQYAYMFADGAESDPYLWIEELGAYSPIVHMQQTDGVKSSHAPFTEETGKDGIITGERMLKSLMQAYEKAGEPGMPEPTDEISLAFEIFISNVQYPQDALENLKDTVAYWRQYIPEDGIPLDEAYKLIK